MEALFSMSRTKPTEKCADHVREQTTFAAKDSAGQSARGVADGPATLARTRWTWYPCLQTQSLITLVTR